MSLPAFSSKFTTDGKLFKRKHGFSLEIQGNSQGQIELIVPYNKAKVNEVEIVNALENDSLDFIVYDSPEGSISGSSSSFLSQFGFDIQLPNGLYRDTSSYDLDVIKDMKIVINYKNNQENIRVIRGNITYHEVK